jgi:hypothetical protein
MQCQGYCLYDNYIWVRFPSPHSPNNIRTHPASNSVGAGYLSRKRKAGGVEASQSPVRVEV